MVPGGAGAGVARVRPGSASGSAMARLLVAGAPGRPGTAEWSFQLTTLSDLPGYEASDCAIRNDSGRRPEASPH
ncbi:hypothetical protein GCM10010495_15940 [Kitasatospora herbaricolor]|nr:hypothetical protein GCM10010495_15940 [Kitasatospora herbaricolor]